jgi:hypothetical protein
MSRSRRSATSATCPPRGRDPGQEYKKEPWARLGVDIEHDFEPLYVVPRARSASR